MSIGLIIVAVILTVIVLFALIKDKSNDKYNKLPLVEREALEAKRDAKRNESGLFSAINPNGELNNAMRCPHCDSKCTVRTKKVELKKGISGAKATGALFTGGTSLLLTGLSRKEDATKAHCDNCNNDWVF